MDYKQQSNQGCLVVDLMYLFGIEPSKEELHDGVELLRNHIKICPFVIAAI